MQNYEEQNVKRINNKYEDRTNMYQEFLFVLLCILTDLFHITPYEVGCIIIPYFTNQEPHGTEESGYSPNVTQLVHGKVSVQTQFEL